MPSPVNADNGQVGSLLAEDRTTQAMEAPFAHQGVNNPGTPQTPNPTAANSGKRRRHVPNLSRTTASPSHGEKMSMLFRHAAEQLRGSTSTPTLASPNVRASRIPLAHARHTRFGESPASRVRSPYSYRSPPKRDTPCGVNDDPLSEDNSGKEPLSSGYIAHIAPPEAWDVADGDEADPGYPTLPNAAVEATQLDINQWLNHLGDPDSSPIKIAHNGYQPNLSDKDSHPKSPIRSASNKENISPTRSFSPIHPPITYPPISTPSRFLTPITYTTPPKTPSTPSRFTHPSTPHGHLSLPPIRKRNPRPRTQPVSKAPTSHIRSASSSSSNQDDQLQQANNEHFTIREDEDCQSVPAAAKAEHKGMDRTIHPSSIETALAQLSPAVSVRNRRNHGRSGRHDLRRHANDNGCSDGGDVGVRGRSVKGEEKVLRSGCVVRVSRIDEVGGVGGVDGLLGESEKGGEMCRPRGFVAEAEAEGREFEFEV